MGSKTGRGLFMPDKIITQCLSVRRLALHRRTEGSNIEWNNDRPPMSLDNSKEWEAHGLPRHFFPFVFFPVTKKITYCTTKGSSSIHASHTFCNIITAGWNTWGEYCIVVCFRSVDFLGTIRQLSEEPTCNQEATTASASFPFITTQASFSHQDITASPSQDKAVSNYY